MSITGSLKNIRDAFSQLVKDNKKQKKTDDSDELDYAQISESVDDVGHTFRDFYPVNPPFGYVGIEMDDKTGKLRYITLEPTLNKDETLILTELKESIIERMDIPLTYLNDTENMEEYLREQTQQFFKRYKKKVAEESEKKFLYYLKRDFLGYGKIDLLMLDQNIEDVSCNGINTPIYVWHRDFESIPTNIIYTSEKELDVIVTRLAYKTGHQISIARPIVEGTLPEGHRVQLTLEEISKRGQTFTVRKFRKNPYTIVDLINFGTISPKIAAYLWVLVENLRSIMICGATASGKTALLNSLCVFVNPEMKVVTIEEVRELRLHENWIPMVTRPSYQTGVQEVSLFDLLKSALRQRPDYIIVGEVRGEEAYTLFQSIAVGHGGLCTIHADSIKSVIKRLLSRPMNIPEMMLPLMNVIMQVKRVKLGDQIVRRVNNVSEITGSPIAAATQTEEVVQLQKRFDWNPEDDSFIFYEPSEIDTILEESKDIFTLISEINHIPVEKLNEEMNRRERILEWMADKGIKSYQEVADIIRKYYQNPDEVYNDARLG